MHATTTSSVLCRLRGVLDRQDRARKNLKTSAFGTYRLAEILYDQGEPVTGQEAEAKSKGVYEAHHKQVLAYCLRRSRNEGWDAAADTLAVAWRRIDIAPDGEEALPWLYTIARMVLANTHLKHKSAARLKARIGGVARVSLVGPEVQVVQRWEEHRLVETVNRLRPDDREALRLVTWEELSHSQIAEVLGISVTAVGQRVHRATKRLHVSDQELLSALRDVNPIPDPDLLLIDEAETRALLATVQTVRPIGPLQSPAELRQRRWRLVAMAAASGPLLMGLPGLALPTTKRCSGGHGCPA